MPGYEKFESMKNGGSCGQFCWKMCGSEKVNKPSVRLVAIVTQSVIESTEI